MSNRSAGGPKPEPFYDCDGITLYHGDARNVLPTLDEEFPAVIFDPPYGEGQGFEGDASLSDAKNLLRDLLPMIYERVRPWGKAACFWTFSNLDVMIDEVRGAGWDYRRLLTMYLPNGSARPDMGFLPRSQPIVIVSKNEPSKIHSEIAEYLGARLENSDHTRSSLAETLGCDSRLVMKWTRVGDPSWCIPTPRFYEPLKEELDLDSRFDFLLEKREDSREDEYIYNHDCYVVENPRNGAGGDHPSPKPLRVVSHLVHTLADKGDPVLDPVAGSGTTLVGAQNQNRRAVGIEIDKTNCERIVERLAQQNIFQGRDSVARTQGTADRSVQVPT